MAGSPPINALAVPMIILNVIQEVCGRDDKMTAKYGEHAEWAVEQVLAHAQVRIRSVLSRFHQ